MQDVKERVALGSIFASGAMTIAKGAVGVTTGSLAILSEAAHSLDCALLSVALTRNVWACHGRSLTVLDRDSREGSGTSIHDPPSALRWSS